VTLNTGGVRAEELNLYKGHVAETRAAKSKKDVKKSFMATIGTICPSKR
jgi:hypothetical protein